MIDYIKYATEKNRRHRRRRRRPYTHHISIDRFQSTFNMLSNGDAPMVTTTIDHIKWY